MSRWISITVEDLNDAKIALLVDALRTKALADDQTDPTPRVTQSVIDLIRRKIASCRTNQVDVDETKIPRGLKTMAVDLIIAELKGRLEEDLTKDETEAIARHVADLNRIANCQDVVEQPDDAIDAPVEATSGRPSISIGRKPGNRTVANCIG
jgi:hypothetical protein